MNPELKGIWQHMRDVAAGALAHANWHAAYMDVNNGRWKQLSILQAAHAAELFVKARIAQEHPLLIFEKIPTPSATGARLDFADLFSRGKTVQWSELPGRLWAVTGIELANAESFQRFGRLRNGIQHFGPATEKDVDGATLRFVFEVIDPLINECWGWQAIDFNEDHEPYIYFVGAMVAREIPFLMSEGAADCFHDWQVDWGRRSPPIAS